METLKHAIKKNPIIPKNKTKYKKIEREKENSSNFKTKILDAFKCKHQITPQYNQTIHTTNRCVLCVLHFKYCG